VYEQQQPNKIRVSSVVAHQTRTFVVIGLFLVQVIFLFLPGAMFLRALGYTKNFHINDLYLMEIYNHTPMYDTTVSGTNIYTISQVCSSAILILPIIIIIIISGSTVLGGSTDNPSSSHGSTALIPSVYISRANNGSIQSPSPSHEYLPSLLYFGFFVIPSICNKQNGGLTKNANPSHGTTTMIPPPVCNKLHY
jgi:hypothetical protein